MSEKQNRCKWAPGWVTAMQGGGVVGALLVAEAVIEPAVKHGVEAWLQSVQPSCVRQHELQVDSAGLGALACLRDRGRCGVEPGHPIAAFSQE